MPQIVSARSLAEVVALADDPPLKLYSGTSNRTSMSMGNASRETIQEEQPTPPLVLYIVRVPGSRDIFLTTMKPLQKVVTAADVDSCLYYVHLDCVGEGQGEDEGLDGEEEGEGEGEDGVEVMNGLPLRTKSPAISRNGRTNDGVGGEYFPRKPLQSSETSQNGNINSNGRINGNENGYTHRPIIHPNKPNLQRKSLQSSETHQKSKPEKYQTTENDPSQQPVEVSTSSKSNFRRKPVLPARQRQLAFDNVDDDHQQGYFQHSTSSRQLDAMRIGQRPAAAVAAPVSQDVDVNSISAPHSSSFRPSVPRPFGPRLMGQRHLAAAAASSAGGNGSVRENVVGMSNSTSNSNLNSNSNLRGRPELPPRPPPRSPLSKEHERFEEGYGPRSLKVAPTRNCDIDQSRQQNERISNSNRVDHAENHNHRRTKSKDSPSRKQQQQQQQQQYTSLTLIRRYAGSQWNVGKIYRTSEFTTQQQHLNGTSRISIDESMADDQTSGNTRMYIDILTPGYQKFFISKKEEEGLLSSLPAISVSSNGTPSHSTNNNNNNNNNKEMTSSHLSPYQQQHHHQQNHQQHLPTNPSPSPSPSPSKPQQFQNPFRRQMHLHSIPSPSSLPPSFPSSSSKHKSAKKQNQDSSSGGASTSSGSSVLRFEKGRRVWRSSFDFHTNRKEKGRTDDGKKGKIGRSQNKSEEEDEEHMFRGGNNHNGLYTTNSSSVTATAPTLSSATTRKPLLSSPSPSSPSPSSTSTYTFLSPWSTTCSFKIKSSGLTNRILKCKHHPHPQPRPVTISELRFNLPSSPTTSTTSTKSAHFNNMNGNNDDDDNMLSLAHDPLGGGQSGKEAKLGKLIIGNGELGRGEKREDGEEGIGMKMLDLLVAANVGLFWGNWGG